MSWLSDNWKRVINPIGPEIEKKIKSDVERWDIGGKRAAERAATEMEARARAVVDEMPTYEIAPEAQQLQELTAQRASDLRTTGADIESLAGSRAGMSQYGGALDMREAMRESTGAAIGDITQLGGSGVSSMGAAARMASSNIGALRDIASQNQMFRDQAQRDYLQSLRERVGLEGQATGLEAQGLQTMISEKDKVYQSDLEKARAQQQLEITLAGNALAQ
jgi:hypothetical protein